MSTPYTRILQALYATTGYAPRGTATQKSARCPAHDDRHPSLSVGVTSTGVVLITCHGGPRCPAEDVMRALGLPLSALWPDTTRTPPPRQHRPDRWMPCGHDRVADYLYQDERGTVLYGVARCDRKGNGCQGFRQWRPDPAQRSGRRWSLYGADGTMAVRLVPYRLPEVITAVRESRAVMITEGEKDAEALRARPGITATCNAMGAGKWQPDFARYFHGADVSIVADRDQAGRDHAQAIVATLMPVARSIHVLQARHGKDVCDHFAAGGTLGDFLQVWAPKPSTLQGISG
ncbi:toprim domain-containing protein [Nonomuraea sp. NPDC048826]|uniref:toprim domain-containing protein n=1 Tax=Nonomuraea sp. NPDC048826 TaxID=3364347 RepID=UPI00371D4E38